MYTAPGCCVITWLTSGSFSVLGPSSCTWFPPPPPPCPHLPSSPPPPPPPPECFFFDLSSFSEKSSFWKCVYCDLWPLLQAIPPCFSSPSSPFYPSYPLSPFQTSSLCLFQNPDFFDFSILVFISYSGQYLQLFIVLLISLFLIFLALFANIFSRWRTFLKSSKTFWKQVFSMRISLPLRHSLHSSVNLLSVPCSS